MIPALSSTPSASSKMTSSLSRSTSRMTLLQRIDGLSQSSPTPKPPESRPVSPPPSLSSWGATLSQRHKIFISSASPGGRRYDSFCGWFARSWQAPRQSRFTTSSCHTEERNMRLVKIGILLLAFIALSAFAAESKHEKDIRECNEQGETAANAAVAKAKLKHPAEVTQVKRKASFTEINKCLRSRGYATGTIR